MFANLSINGKPAPSQGWQTVETAAGCHTTISFAAIDSRICDSPACVLAPPTSAAPASATCTSTAWEQQECTVGCGRLQVLPVPIVAEGYPHSDKGLPDFAQLGPAAPGMDGGTSPGAWWQMSLTPSLQHASQVPYRLCLTPGLSLFPGHPGGPPLCLAVAVRKCRYCAAPGDTLLEVAAALQIDDWMPLFLANPALATHDPDRLPPGAVLRLGVAHAAKPGEALGALARQLSLIHI